jgi:acid phosphatase (class A)
VNSKFLILIASLVLANPLVARDRAIPFTDSKEVNLLTLLPTPPAVDSPRTKAELETVLATQNHRTATEASLAMADATENVWRFANVVADPKFKAENLPVFSAFFTRVVATESAVVDPAKDSWKRPRPHMVDSRVKPIVKLSTSGSYPSGQTTVGTLMGIVLAQMLPENRTNILARAWAYGQNRVIAGIHYPSDIEAGRLSGTAIAAVLATHSDFNNEFQAAKAELRAVLGLR